MRTIVEEALAAKRRAITKEEPSEPTLGSVTSYEQAHAKPAPEPELLSHEAIAAVGSAFSSLTEL